MKTGNMIVSGQELLKDWLVFTRYSKGFYKTVQPGGQFIAGLKLSVAAEDQDNIYFGTAPGKLITYNKPDDREVDQHFQQNLANRFKVFEVIS
jgi:hypothetical protein